MYGTLLSETFSAVLLLNVFFSIAKEEALEIFCPNQLGVAIRGGAESIIHATKLIYEECGKREGLGVLQINSIKRQGVLSVCLKQIACIYPFVISCYAKHSSVLYIGQAINSESGLQQGNPLGQFCFP